MIARLSFVTLEDRTVPSGAAPVLPEIDGPMQLHLQEVAARGRALGNRADVFAKVGDSNTESQDFVTALGAAGYNPAASGLADRPDLIATWAAYHATSADGRFDSFARDSIGSTAGWNSENLRGNVSTEIATIHPAIAIVMIGTNDIGTINDLAVFRDNLTRVVRNCLDLGVIPIISTIPDLLVRPDWNARVADYNAVIEEITTAEDVPLWNFHRQSVDLPNRGLRTDNVHLSVSPNGSGQLGGADLAFGDNLRNRTTLEVLAKLRTIVFTNGVPDGETPPPATDWTPIRPGQRVLAVGSGLGHITEVAIYDADTNALLSHVLPYESTFRGGVSVAVGDVNGDGVADIVTGPGPGGAPLVKAFSGADGQLIRAWFAYEESFRGGVTLAVGDVNADGAADIAVGSGRGGGPRVRVFDGRNALLLADFFAYESTFRDGVNVALAIDASGTRILTGPGIGGGPVAMAFDLGGQRLFADFAFDSAFRGGISVAAGDVTGDGIADYVIGAGPGGGPAVRVYDPVLHRWTDGFFPFDESSRTGVRVAVAGGKVIASQVLRDGSTIALARLR